MTFTDCPRSVVPSFGRPGILGPVLASILGFSACSPGPRRGGGAGGGAGSLDDGGAGTNDGSGNQDVGGGPGPSDRGMASELDPGKPFGGDYDDPSAPPGAKDAFGGAPSGMPDPDLRIVYPLDGA